MKIGFSLSPGGLMLPYHVGVLAALQYNGILDDHSPLAGSSAGSIAVVAHSCGIPAEKILQATIKVSDTCAELGGARGRLLPLLKQQMTELIDDDAYQTLSHRPGQTGVAYREVFPRPTNVLQTKFTDSTDLIQATSFSCMFPFFSTPWPCALDTTTTALPRLLVDGYFTVPRNRFGCPDLPVDRTVAVSVFPSSIIGMDAFADNDIISPSKDMDIGYLVQVATQATSSKDLTAVYEMGWNDAEQWCIQEKRNEEAMIASF